MKKEDYINWDEYFFGVAMISSFRSKDGKKQVGSCIVDTNKKIIGVGYNGLPRNFNDKNKKYWGDEDDNDKENSKHSYVIHSEMNAILNSTKSVENSKIYITLFPCINCSKLIIQSGIKEIYYIEEKGNKKDLDLIKKILKTGKVKIKKFNISKSIFLKNLILLKDNLK